MADTYDIIICGAGSGGGFMSGEVAPNASVLILDAGPHVTGEANPGVGAPNRRKYSTQINLGQYIPDSNASNRGDTFFSYPMYMDESNPAGITVQREPRVVGGGSFINVGAWLRPRLVDWDGFSGETGVTGWTKNEFEPHFLRAERILHVHRDLRENWNKASVYYEATALRMGIPVFETASNRFHCIFCGHRLNAGMPCKYDALQSTAITQIPKALKAGATLIDNATVVKIEITNGVATGVTYRRNGQLTTVNARKLVVASAGAIGTPLLLRNSGVHLQNPNVGNYLRAHPGAPIEVLLPPDEWHMDRGYQWNIHHFIMDKNGQPLDAVAHLSASFPANTPWVSAAFQIGLFGKPYKDLMRRFPQRAGAFIFTLKPDIYGRVIGTVDAPVINYPIANASGLLEPKTLSDLVAGVRQVASVFKQFGAITSFPNPDAPDAILKSGVSLFVTTSGALHPQGTCRAGSKQSNSVVDTNGMSWDVKNLMCCDASIIPHHISANPNATIMALASRCADYVNTQILGKSSTVTAQAELLRYAQAEQEPVSQ